MTSRASISCAAAALALGVVAGACSTSDSAPSTATRDCDPLSVDAEPIALGEVIGAGRAADGKIYVLDRASRNIRGFVSEGNVLRRRNVVGSGEGPDFVVATFEEPDRGRLQVRVELAGGTATRMGISRGEVDPKTKSFEIGTQGEELALLPAAELSSFRLANIGTIGIMYAATTEDGHRFYAFEPKIDISNEKVRAFYGTPDRMVERRVFSVQRSSAAFIDLDLEGVRTRAVLTFCISGTAFGRARLEPEGGPGIALTPVPGSPGGVTCSHLIDAGGDAGADAGSAALPADAVTLTAGLRFVCF